MANCLVFGTLLLLMASCQARNNNPPVVPIGSVPFRDISGCGNATGSSHCFSLILQAQLEKAKLELASEIRTLGDGHGYDPMTELSLPPFKGPAGLSLEVSNITLYGLSNITLSVARINGSQVTAALELRRMRANGAINISGLLGSSVADGFFYSSIYDLRISGTGSIAFRKGRTIVDDVAIGLYLGKIKLDIKDAGFIGNFFATYVTANQDKLKKRFLPPLKDRLAELVKKSLTDIFNRSTLMRLAFGLRAK